MARRSAFNARSLAAATARERMDDRTAAMSPPSTDRQAEGPGFRTSFPYVDIDGHDRQRYCSYRFSFARCAAQRRFCASLIRFRASADIRRRLRGVPVLDARRPRRVEAAPDRNSGNARKICSRSSSISWRRTSAPARAYLRKSKLSKAIPPSKLSALSSQLSALSSQLSARSLQFVSVLSFQRMNVENSTLELNAESLAQQS